MRNFSTCVRVAYINVFIGTHSMICKLCTAVHCNDTVFHCNERQTERKCLFPLTLNHTQTQGRLPAAFCQSTSSPARLSLGRRRLHSYPSESLICLLSPQTLSLGPAVGTTGQTLVQETDFPKIALRGSF